MARAMNSLLVLRDQVNGIAPDRSTASDGLIGDAQHQTRNSDHNPHYVPGVGDGIITALDLTHDPDHGFDSYAFAEVLRLARDPRIKYVISNGRIFYGYATPTRKAWTWYAYTGTDPHTNHVHVSVVENALADTKTPWNLEGYDDMTPSQQYIFHVMNYRLDAILHMRPNCVVPPSTASDGTKFPGFTEVNHLALAINGLESDAPGDPVDLAALIKQAVTDPAVLAAQADAVAEEVTDRQADAARAEAAALDAAS